MHQIPQAHSGKLLQCNTCQKWVEINEEILRNKNENSFEWICATSTCRPNHQPSILPESTNLSPNQYKHLDMEEKSTPCTLEI